ncbi:OmpA family protein [Pseudomonas sp. zfem005]|uniref:OmpA family protein n=1 Tax=Pseudomonas sp. zfem005 TaxID=3078200 RepID=UPI0029295B4E|nr:OmpA family protein [Pseudomonas sp. zfem005]MDU9414393.1 OmpA family protein [Pseudomonas sp. zfem005]
MRPVLVMPLLSALGLALAGCATPPENPDLLKAREAFAQLTSKPESSTLAALQTQVASKALNDVEVYSELDREAPEIDHLAYLANRKIELAEQTIIARKAAADLKKTDNERTQVQLEVRTQQLKALQALNAKPSERGQVVTFGDVLFDTGKAELKYGSQRNLQQLATFLSENPERKVRIEGFTDSTGGELLNLRLSEHRAESVARALERLGIGRERLITKGYGPEFPVSDNGSIQGRQLNRRVEVIISNSAAPVSDRS